MTLWKLNTMFPQNQSFQNRSILFFSTNATREINFMEATIIEGYGSMQIVAIADVFHILVFIYRSCILLNILPSKI